VEFVSTFDFGLEVSPIDGMDDFHKSHPVSVRLDGFLPSLEFAFDAHRENPLPFGMGNNLCDEQVAYRSP